MYKYIVFSIMLCILLTSCPVMDTLDDDPIDATLLINNNSKKDILFCHSFSYPDTSLNMGSWFLNKQEQENALIKSKSTKQYPRQWRLLLDKENSNFKLFIFIFDKDIVETIPWDTIKKNYLILKRYDLTLKQLDSMNWTITYP